MTQSGNPSRRQLILMCVCAALTVATCAGLFGAAALVPAPPAVLPFVVAVCIGGPMLAAWWLRSNLGALRGVRPLPAPLDGDALAEMRRHLDDLPETQHPLGL